MCSVYRTVRTGRAGLTNKVPALPSSSEIAKAGARLRATIERPLPPVRIASAIAGTIARWRERNFAPRKKTIAQVSRHLGFSLELLEESLDALLLPFTGGALEQAASRAKEAVEVIAFVMAGNVTGAGLHEVVLALIAGAGVLIKTASREPAFFREFANTLIEQDPEVGGRLAVLTWPRERTELTEALRSSSNLIVAYGDDSTISVLRRGTLGFGSRLSGAVIARDAIGKGDADEIASLLARDVTLFEQLGCLSPHHIFVEGDGEIALGFAERLGTAMSHWAELLPPPTKLELEDAAALRGARETARWRAIAGDPVRVIEGPGLSWVVIFDRDAALTPSPGLRCVRVSAIADLRDLRTRLDSAQGRIEAFAVTTDGTGDSTLREILREIGISYVARVGAMQSPPLTWRHGGGAFLDRVARQS